MSKDSVKTQIDIDITNKTTSKSISPLNVGGNMKSVVDLIPDPIVKTNGSVDAINGSKATLQYDINTVNKSGGSEVKLPTTTEVGKEVLFLASNYAGTVSVYVNDVEDIKLSGGVNGISGNQQSLQINANEAYRFIYRTDNYWYFEKIIDIPNNYYQLVSERTTDGTLSTNSNFKYPTEQAVKTYVDGKISAPQDLKSVVDVSGYAWKDSEFNYISLLNGSAYNRTISWDLNDAAGKNSSLTFDSGNLLIDSKTTTFGMQLRSTEGIFSVTQHTDDIFIKSTLNLAIPTVSSVISVTAPTVAGNYRIPVEPQNTYTVATLPTAVLGSTAVVTDATAPTYLGTLVGGGSVICPVWYNGTSWKSR